MSVYKRSDSKFYHYDFQYKGQRFNGSTGCTSEREATAFERQEKDRVRREGGRKLLKPTKGNMTIGHACNRYFDEKGRFLQRPDQVEYSLALIIEAFGEETRLAAIDSKLIAAQVATRRAARVSNIMRDEHAPSRRRRRGAGATPPKLYRLPGSTDHSRTLYEE